MNSLTRTPRHEARIVTEHVFPPIPIRTMDWCAWRDGFEEAHGYGWGETEAEAIWDLHRREAEAPDDGTR